VNITADAVAERTVDQPVALEGAFAREGRTDDQGVEVHIVRAVHGGDRLGQVSPDQRFNLLWSHAGIGDRTSEARHYR